VGKYTGGPSHQQRTNSALAGGIEDSIRKRRRDQSRANAMVDQPAANSAPMVCPVCKQSFPVIDRCPDCNEMLVDAEFVDAASEYHNVPRITDGRARLIFKIMVAGTLFLALITLLYFMGS